VSLLTLLIGIGLQTGGGRVAELESDAPLDSICDPTGW
jgi:hypothetical protein